LKDATAHAEMLALTQAQQAVGMAFDGLHPLRDQGTMPNVRGAAVHVRLARVSTEWRSKAGAAGSAMNILQFPTLNHRCDITSAVREKECHDLIRSFFSEQRTRSRTE